MARIFTPHYIRIRNEIINRINAGEIKKDQKLPSERELADQFGVSRISVVGALRELEEQGIIRKIKGSGSYVNCSSVDNENEDDIFGAFFSGPRISITHGILICPPQTFSTMRTLAELFRMENPEIKVDVQMLNPQGYVDDCDPYLALIGSGKPPTTGEFFFHSDYSALNALIPLENLPGFEELTAKLLPGAAVPTLDAEGHEHIHAISTRMNIRTCLVNVDFLYAAGIRRLPEAITYEILDEWAPILGDYSRKHAGTYGMNFSIPSGWRCVIGNIPYLWGTAEGLDTSAGSFSRLLEQDSCLTGLAALARWYQSGNPPPMYGDELFALGMIGINVSSTMRPWLLKEVLTSQTNIRYYPMPVPYGQTDSTSLLGNFSAGIFRGNIKNEEELNAAWRWLKFLFRKKSQYQLSFDYDFPTLIGAKSRLHEWPEIPIDLMEKAFHSACPQFDFKNIRAILSIFGDELRPCMLGSSSPETCIANTRKRISDIIHL